MSAAAWLLILAASVAAPDEPLAVHVVRQRDALELRFELLTPLPEPFIAALPSGAQVRVVYPVRLRSRRALLGRRPARRGDCRRFPTRHRLPL
jgi:hypothetical protein